VLALPIRLGSIALKPQPLVERNRIGVRVEREQPASYCGGDLKAACGTQSA
jgi:hypothetical protein